MSPPTGTPNPNSEEDPMALAEARAALESIARRKGIVAEDDDYAEDDDVPTDEEGYEIPSVQTAAAPDRRIVPSTDAEPEGSLDRVVSAPLGIQQVDDLKDEAKAEGMDVAGDDDEDDDEDEDEDDDDEDDDDDDDDEEDDDTDEDGNKIVKEQAAALPSGRSISPNAGSDTDAETHAAPDVSSDRTIPAKEAAADRRAHPGKSAPLGIKEIENLEDDAMGG